MKLKVFLNMYGIRQEVGLLLQDKQRIFFEYSPDFLKSGIELSPFKLPLKAGVFEEKSRVFDGLFGLFNDSLPDGWGCLLLDRKLRKLGKSYAEITPLDRLSLIGANPMGALEYEPAAGDSALYGDIELDSLSGEVDRILDGEESTVLDELLKLNGSSGGARPKIVACVSSDRKQIIHGGKSIPDGFTPWIIKFSEKHDPQSSGELEYRYSLAAKAAGITMPETHLFPLKDGRGCFGVQRFDRTPEGKVHIHTACGLLHASHRFASLDYENLLKLTWILTKNHADVVEMVRRMIFNIKSGNKDDHSKNFSFLLNSRYQWQLAPAYDLTPSAGINGEQTCMVNGKGRNITDADLIKTAATANISEAETKTLIAQVNSALTQYNIC
ncbi:MAG: type II toxin-antitoxin system HipA family toxin [Lentisphaerae bacterium]|nr:type II toxin-antitoxin system HipA family toxin [Lentisphaerota bacterium]